MRNLIKIILIISLFTILSACSYIKRNSPLTNRDTTYLQARSIPPLQIPPGLSSSSIHEQYPVPDRHYPESAKNVSLIPPGL